MSFESKIKKWTSNFKKVDEYFRRAIVENQEELLDLNIAQLESGKDSLGAFLDQYASDAYAKFKKFHGSQAPLGIPDLKLEGDFHSGFILKADGSEFIFTSTDEKKDRLVDKYGEDIFGLSEDSLSSIREVILESFLTHFRNGLL